MTKGDLRRIIIFIFMINSMNVNDFYSIENEINVKFLSTYHSLPSCEKIWNNDVTNLLK